MKTRIIGCSAALLIAACAPEVEQKPAAQWETLAQWGSNQPGCAEQQDLLIRTEGDWAEYWTQVHPGSEPARPSVDFAVDSVLATCGPRPSPGYSGEITEVSKADDAGDVVDVTVTDHQPGPNCMHPAVVVYGHHAVKVEGVPGSARFTHEPLPGPAC